MSASWAIARVVARATPSRVMTRIAASTSSSRRWAADMRVTRRLLWCGGHLWLQEGASFATICGRLVDHSLSRNQMKHVRVLAELTGLRVPEPDPVSDAQVRCCVAHERGLYLARTLLLDQAQALRPARHRQPVTAGRSGRDPTSAQDGDVRRARSPHHGQCEQRRRLGPERRVLVEQSRAEETGPRRDVGHGRFARSAGDAARASAVDELEGLHLRHRLDRSRATLAELVGGDALEHLDSSAAQQWAGVVGNAGDLALVAHDAYEGEPRTTSDLLRER